MLLYQSEEIGLYLCVLGPLMPLMYLAVSYTHLCGAKERAME